MTVAIPLIRGWRARFILYFRFRTGLMCESLARAMGWSAEAAEMVRPAVAHA